MRDWPPASRSSLSEPIRSRDRRGFVIGWLSIVAVGAAMFAIVTLPLPNIHDDLPLITQHHADIEMEAPRVQM